jgi:RNA polymerase sigma-70 factor, ECF subfamily
MKKSGSGPPARPPRRSSARHSTTLLSDRPTIDLVMKARKGDGLALEALLQRSLPQLKRWAHGRLPAAARGHIDTGDLVQDAAMNAIARLDKFEPRHVGSLQAYLRRSVINRIRDEMRRVVRRPVPTELDDRLKSTEKTPEDKAISVQTYDRYKAALKRLRPKDRELVVARIEAQWTLEEIEEQFGFPTRAATGMALTRAMKSLKILMEFPKPGSPTRPARGRLTTGSGARNRRKR